MKTSIRHASFRFATVVCAALGLSGGAATSRAAAPGPETALTLDQTVAEAVRANHGLQAKAHLSTAAVSDAKAASRSRLGDLNGIASYGYYNDDQIVRPMSAQLIAGGMGGLPFDRSQAHYGVAYEVPLYVGGRLVNQIAIARLEARKAEALREGASWQVRFNAVSLYAAAQALDLTVTGLRDQLAALDQTKASLDEFVSLGKRPEVDRLKVIDEREAARAQLAAVQADRVKVGALLLAVMGRDPAGALAVEPLADAPALPSFSRADVQSRVMASSPVLVAGWQADQADRATTVARSAFLPKVVGGANYQEHTGLNGNRTLDTWGFSVGVVVPLFSGTADVQRLIAVRERRSAAREAFAQAQLQASADVQDALARLDSAQTAVSATEARVAAATEAARIERVRYDTGASTMEDLLRALARQEGAQAAQAAARAERVTAAERINSLAEQEILK